jgi:hypothetical protein
MSEALHGKLVKKPDRCLVEQANGTTIIAARGSLEDFIAFKDGAPVTYIVDLSDPKVPRALCIRAT